jgi:two-component system chemotaxis response regulator CheY
LQEEDDSFLDFDEFEEFDDFNDFDEFNDFVSTEVDNTVDIQSKLREHHEKVSSKEFLEDYLDLEYILDDIDEIEMDIGNIIEDIDEDNLLENIFIVENILHRYSSFLNTFSDFYELSLSLNILIKILINADLKSLDSKSKKFVAGSLSAIFNDLNNWKDHVFVLQDAIDIFYMNESLLSSCIQLESYIHSKLS